MKTLKVLLGGILLASALAAHGATGLNAPAAVQNMAGLMAYQGTNHVYVSGYWTPSDGGGGLFSFSQSLLATNPGTVLTNSGKSGQWQRQFSGAIDVKWFGAKGDNVADETALIQAAINLCATNGGGQVFLSPGRYKISSAMLLPNNTEFFGMPGHSILNGPFGAMTARSVAGTNIYASVAMVAVTNCEVHGITVDNAANGTSANGILFGTDGGGVPAVNCSAWNNRILGSNSHQYLVVNFGGRDIQIRNNYLHGGVLAPDFSSGQVGIETFGGDGVLISGNVVEYVGGNATHPLSDRSYSRAHCKNVTVVNNKFYRCRVGYYPAQSGSYGAHFENIIEANNQYIECWDSGAKLTWATNSVITGFSLGASHYTSCSNAVRFSGTSSAIDMSGITVRGLTISNASGAASALLLENVKNLSLSGVVIEGSWKNAAWISGCSNITFDACQFNNSSNSAAYVTSSTNIFFRACDFRNWNLANGAFAGVTVAPGNNVDVRGSGFFLEQNESFAVDVPLSASVDCDVLDNYLHYTVVSTNGAFRNNSLRGVTQGGVILRTDGLTVSNVFVTGSMTFGSTVVSNRIDYTTPLSNGGFETVGGGGADVFASWTEVTSGSSTITDETVIVNSGGHALAINVDGSASSVSMYQGGILGKRYSYSFYARCDSTTASMVVGGNGAAAQNTHNLTTNYTLFTGQYTADSTTVGFSLKRNGSASRIIYVDDVTVQELTSIVEINPSAAVTLLNVTTNSQTAFSLNRGGYVYVAGRQGIGTNAPNTTLEVKGTLRVTKDFSGTQALDVSSTGIVTVPGTLVLGPGGASLTNTLAGSATLDFPSTIAQTHSDLTLTVTGAADGDVVDIGVPNGATMDNSSYSAWVSGANTVTIRFLNAGVLTRDPASGTFKAIVWKF